MFDDLAQKAPDQRDQPVQKGLNLGLDRYEITGEWDRTDPNRQIVPFLKWAGGKRWLASAHPELFPESYQRYIEPFLGSGAVFFHQQPKRAILSDCNPELINAYTAIKDNWYDVYQLLLKYQNLHSKDFYYEMRSKALDCKIERASQFIYLNRTCFNGIYRVNLKGVFNVPIGTKQSVVLKSDNFQKTSALLSRSSISTADFDDQLEQAKKGDFVFIDPPYTVKHNNNGFVKYNDHLFSWNDQIRLRDSVEKALSKGAKVLLTNADHESVRELYRGMGEMLSLNRNSVISGASSARGKYSELVLKSY